MSFTLVAGGFRRLFCLFVLGFTFSAAVALEAAPVAPSLLHGVVISDTQIALYWNDNSTDETHFRFRYSANGQAPQTFDLISGTGSGTGAVFATLTVGAGVSYSIDVSSYTGTPTNISTYTGQPITITTTPFGAPVIKGTYLQSDGAVLALWTDNSSAEAGYLVEMREQSVGGFQTVAAPAANTKGLWLPIMKPGVRYEVRMRAYQGSAGSPSAVTAYSNTVLTDVIPALPAPSNLLVTAPDETSVSLTLKDNSANSVGYEVEVSFAGLNQFSAFATVADPTDSGNGLDTLSFPDTMPPGTALDFRVRAFYLETQNGPRTYSAWSANGTVTTPFYAPANLYATASSSSPYHISFYWTDTSRVEEAYELQYREAGTGGAFQVRKYFPGEDLSSPFQTSYSDLPGFKPGTTYEFRLRSVLGDLETAFTPTVTATTRPGFTSPLSVQVYVNVPFTYSLTTASQTPGTGFTASALPAGVTLQPPGGPLVGTVSTPGVYTFPITASFQGGATHQTTMTLRAIAYPGSPLLPVPVPDQTLTLSGQVQIPLQNYFSDPDSESVMRMHTNLGDVDLILYNTATPQTVANFLSYVNSHRFDGALFHRSEEDFVFQGGGYTVNSSQQFVPISTDAPVVNEPGLQNVVGTVAMAKLEDLPDSATNQFFFNMNDNQANLDYQNDGFTVFARVGLSSYPVLYQMALAPLADYNVAVKYGPSLDDVVVSPFHNLPLTTAPLAGQTTLDVSKLIKISSLEPVPVLTYEIVTAPNASVAVASLVGGSSLKIVPVAPGTTTVRIGAVDRDGQGTAYTLNIQVTQTFGEWASANSLTGSNALATGDADQDGLSALEEFAFVGDPTRSLPTERPVSSTATTAEGSFLQVTFPVRHHVTGLTYIVEGCNDLVTADWLPIWSSNDTLSAPPVVNVVPGAGFDRVTVRDSVSTGASDRRFLRIRLVTP